MSIPHAEVNTAEEGGWRFLSWRTRRRSTQGSGRFPNVGSSLAAQPRACGYTSLAKLSAPRPIPWSSLVAHQPAADFAGMLYTLSYSTARVLAGSVSKSEF